MPNALTAIAAALGGGALGGAQALGQIDQSHDQDRQFNFQVQRDKEQRDIQLKQLFQQRQELDFRIKNSTDERERQSLLDEQKKIDEWAANLQRAGVTFTNPTKAYQHAMANPQSLLALTKAAQTRAAELARNNQPVGALTGTDFDAEGGALVDNKTFSPFGYMSAGLRTGASNEKVFVDAIQGARNRILRARNNAIEGYKQSSGVGATLASVQDPAARMKIQDEINSAGDIEARKAANAELTALRAAFPNDPRLNNLTVEDLLQGSSGGPSTPSGASAADPLGLGGRGPAPSGANRAPATTSPPAPTADPLGLAPRRSVNPRPAPAGPQNDPLGILNRPPGF